MYFIRYTHTKHRHTIVYNIGLTLREAQEVSCWRRVTLVTFPFHLFPEHVLHLYNYAWKVLILYVCMYVCDERKREKCVCVCICVCEMCVCVCVCVCVWCVCACMLSSLSFCVHCLLYYLLFVFLISISNHHHRYYYYVWFVYYYYYYCYD